MSDKDGFLPQSRPSTGNDEYNALVFVVKQMLGGLNVATLVQIKAVHTTGRIAPVGLVDVLPLVEQTDGSGRPIPHAIVNNVPYLRLQGGSAAVIVDPQVGDIGLCVFADRDLSSVKASKTAKPPGSRRRFSMADGFYFGGWSPTTPTKALILDASGCEITCDTKVDGNENVTGVYQVAGTQVVGPRQTNIPVLTVTGSAADPVARAGVNSILALLQAHGLMA